ncbi:RNA polymerase sigma factor [Streptomyces narbonensis]|uniref:RNA polymerase sigma factor n=1 Tax=Streptomyces narbonensis TaxID=67333 RepID=UPI0034010A2F
MPDARAAFDERILRTHQDKGKALLRHARRRLGAEGLPASRADAEDILQDALVTALTNTRSVEIENLYGYLCAVIRNRVRDLSRRKAASPLDTTCPAAEGHRILWVSDVEGDIEERLDTERALKRMSPQQRRLILLSKGMGYTHAEIARITGLHRGSVATHISRASRVLAAIAVTAVTALALWTQNVAAHLYRTDPASDGRPSDITASVFLCLVLIAPALGSTVWRRAVTYVRGRRWPGPTRNTQVLHAMLQVSAELTAEHGSPTREHYARRLQIPMSWITLNTLRSGHLPGPTGMVHSVTCRFLVGNGDDWTVCGITSGRPGNELSVRIGDTVSLDRRGGQICV